MNRQYRWVAAVLLSILFTSFSALAAISSYAVIGDAGMWNENSKMVRDSIYRSSVKDLILPGDNLYNGKDYDTAWAPWKKLGLNFAFVAIGNHNASYRSEIRYFKMPGEHYTVSPQPGVR